MTRLRLISLALAAALVGTAAAPADAGWGHRGQASYASYGGYASGGSYGGYAAYSSYGGGSTGGYGAAYASTGGYGASYGGGSSGGFATAGYGSVGSYGSYGTANASHGGVRHQGPLRRLLARRHAHHGRHGGHHGTGGSTGGFVSAGYGSYGGGSYGGGSYGGGSYGSFYGGSSGGSTGGYGSYGAGVGSSYYAPAAPAYGESYGGAVEQEVRLVPARPGRSQVRYSEPTVAADTALLTVAVPEDAEVIVNGNRTSSTGAVRQFMSRGLEAGFSYTYEVEVQFASVDGEPIVQTRSVRLRGGDRERLVFDGPEEAVAQEAGDVETSLTLKVPADARVTLAGNPTVGEGAERTFRTHQLAEGEVWEDYTVRVTVERDGREISKEQRLELAAGSDLELNFQFDETSLAWATR